jgi:hypothetical protein
MPPENLQYTCPFCDSQVIVGKACPGCAKKNNPKKPGKRSWEQPKAQDGLDLPDDDFDYDDFVAREFGKVPHRQTGIQWYWWALALALLVAMTAGLFING